MSAGTTACKIATLRTTALLGFSALLALLAPGSATIAAQNRFSVEQLKRSAAAAGFRQAAPRQAASAPAVHQNPFSVEQIQAVRAARARAAAPEESTVPAAPAAERAEPRHAAAGRATPRPGGSASRRNRPGTEAVTTAAPAPEPEPAIGSPLVVIATSWGDRSGRTLPRTPITGKRQAPRQAPTGQAAGSATRKASRSPRDRQQQDESSVHINIWDAAYWPRFRDASCRDSYWANPYGYRSLAEAPNRRRFRRS